MPLRGLNFSSVKIVVNGLFISSSPPNLIVAKMARAISQSRVCSTLHTASHNTNSTYLSDGILLSGRPFPSSSIIYLFTLFLIRMQSDCYFIHWVTIHLLLLSCVQFFVTTWTVACQAPLFMGLPRQEQCSGLPFPSPGDLPNPGIKLESPALAGGFFTMEPPRKPHHLLLFLFIVVLKSSHSLSVGASFKMPMSFHHDSTFWGALSYVSGIYTFPAQLHIINHFSKEP